MLRRAAGLREQRLHLIAEQWRLADHVDSEAVVTQEAYANGNAYLTLSAKGLQLWDRGWASFRNG